MQEALWLFRRALGRLQEVLEGFWAENDDFSYFFEGLRGGERAGAVGGAAGLGPPKPRFFLRKSTKAKTVNGKR